MAIGREIWRPGSFTKNFSWGRDSGLRELYEIIRVGFDGVMEDVPRSTFRARVKIRNRPDFIAINFFLFNKPIDGTDYIIADELVYQALTAAHSSTFDKLALFAFNLSMCGRWAGSHPYQRRPALWANKYIVEHVSAELGWDTKSISADDIQDFVAGDVRYQAETTRKLATNLYHLYSVGGISRFSEPRISRWWVDSLFLMLDRVIEDRSLDGKATPEGLYGSLLAVFDFLPLTGGSTVEKELATKHLVALYSACGSRERFSDKLVNDRTNLLLPEVQNYIANDSRPGGAVHPTNPRILKSIPRICAMLAKYIAGFDFITPDEMEEFDLEEFIRRRTEEALRQLREKDITPTMTADEIMRITRER
jgi:hypothetical protein